MNAFLALALLLSPLHAHQEPRGIGNLIVPGDRVEIVYASDSTRATGTLYVRNDRMARFAALRLRKLRAVVPQSLIRGSTLTYYAVIRDPKTGRTARMPRRTAWILAHSIRVQLGTHRFGKTRAPEASVAHWPASAVGWQSEGDAFGPETFLLGRDGSIWLNDGLNGRLLVSRDGISRTVPLPEGTTDGDVAFGPAGTVYVSGGEGVGLDHHRVLYRLGPTGDILWKRRLYAGARDGGSFLVGANSPLRLAGGALYCLVGMPALPGGEFAWMPVATSGGQALTPAAQRAGTRWPYQPLAGGLRLVSELYTPPGSEAPREARYALVRGSRLVRAWRVVSKTDVNFDYFTPELSGGDLVTVLDVTKQTPAGFRWEYTVLRLGPHGLKARFSLPRAVYGDNLLADLRVGPDGNLYQLASSPQDGVTIERYSLR